MKKNKQVAEGMRLGDRARITIKKSKSSGMNVKQEVEVIGITKFTLIKNTGLVIPVLDGRNQLVSINQLFADCLDSSVNIAIANLFNVDEVQYGGAQDGKDGIVCVRESDNVSLTCTTTTVSAANTYGFKWQGEILFTGPTTIDTAFLGKNYRGDSTPPPPSSGEKFVDEYAKQFFTPQPVQENDRMIFEWEIYIT